MSALAAGNAALTQLQFLADDTDVGDETHKAGPIAVVVIVVLCVACFVLFRSMTKHMRRVREQFPPGQEPGLSGGPSGDTSDPVERAATAPAATTATATTTPRSTPKSRAHTPDPDSV